MTDFKRKTPQQRANYVDALLTRESQPGVGLLMIVTVPDDGSDPDAPKSVATVRWCGFQDPLSVAAMLREMANSIDPAAITEVTKQ